MGFSTAFTERLYKIYLNHSKVIHYRDGHPVYSLSTPALYSKPAANMFARTLYRGIQNRNMPNLMSFAVTDVLGSALRDLLIMLPPFGCETEKPASLRLRSSLAQASGSTVHPARPAEDARPGAQAALRLRSRLQPSPRQPHALASASPVRPESRWAQPANTSGWIFSNSVIITLFVLRLKTT